MRPVLQTKSAQRPDPYLDWELRTRPPLRGEKSGDRWCSLYIKVKPDAGDSHLSNLRGLCSAVASGRLEEDRAQPGDPTIRMADDELQHLKNVIKAVETGKIQPTADKVLMQFFVYRLESLIYSEGRYASTDLYDVILAGPPIAGLTFNMLVKPRHEPTAFESSPDIDLRGVAIGIIDDGIAFAHERFRSGPDTSRVMAIWLQEVERENEDHRVAFGRRLTNDEINTLIAEEKTEADIYRKIGMTDFGKNRYNPLASRASHGTHVLDVAAGYDPDIRSDEIRPILAVQLPSVATLDTSGVTMGSYVLQAVRQIMLWADALGNDIPLVINFSYGLAAGPKDGTHELERALGELISYRNRRASTCLVLPAGNTYRARTTAKMALATGEARTLDWMILPDDQTANFMEIWLDAELGERTDSPIEVTLTPPGASDAAARPTEGSLGALIVNEKPIAATYYNISKSKRGRVFIAVNQTASKEGRVDCAPAGRWRLTLRNTSDQDVVAHLYIQRDSTPFGYRRPGRQSFFDHPNAYRRDDVTGAYDQLDENDCPITQRDTLSALATSAVGGDSQIFVVGAADASQAFLPASYTSSGPTPLRDGPDCSAVTEEGRGHGGVLAAGTFGGSIVKMNGTSVAAPQLVRKIANDFVSNRRGISVPAVSGRLSREPAIGVSDQEVISVSHGDSLGDTKRLGAFILRRRPNRHVPTRRYPTTG